ncbi:MAG: sugar ABC transporter permease [Tyzzerella sp.]|nr:sugar ABC transporter permease [Tyzzerella sp.]
MKKKKRDNIFGVLFAMSPLVGFALFGVLPLIFSIVLSFGNLPTYNLLDIEFCGLDNYIRIFTEDAEFGQSIGNTFLYSFITVGGTVVISLIASLFLNKIKRGGKLIRIILFIPYVCSVVATSTMWKWLFDYNYGVLNDIVEFFGMTRVNWLGEAATAMPIMILMSIWGGLGYNMILYSAALNSVSRTYYEAAELDGAGSIKQFFSITLPMISPTTFFIMVMGFIGALQSFANFQVMTPSGGPDGTTWTMVFRVWYVAFVEDSYRYGMGYASAMSWIVGGIVMIFTAIMFGLSRRWVNYDV